MKIAVVGCGAVGSYYGAMLGRVGHEVHFLLRSDYATVARDGVKILSPNGDFEFRPHAARTPESIGSADLVLIALKSTANDQFGSLLPPLVNARTAILTLQNGLGNEAALARLFPADHIFGGLCFVCLNRTAPGVIQHLDHGLIRLGEYHRPPGPRTRALAAAFQHAGVPCTIAADLDFAHWEKLVWNIPFNGLGVASAAGFAALADPPAPPPWSSPLETCLMTNQLLDGGWWETLVRALMLEVIAAATALGHPLDPQLADHMIERTRTMGPYKPSTVLDFELGRPLELESLFLEPWRQAQEAGVTTPRLARLVAVLIELSARPRRT